MFLKVIDKDDIPMLINADHICYIIQGEGESVIVYDDDSTLRIKDDLIKLSQQIARMKGADDE